MVQQRHIVAVISILLIINQTLCCKSADYILNNRLHPSFISCVQTCEVYGFGESLSTPYQIQMTEFPLTQRQPHSPSSSRFTDGGCLLGGFLRYTQCPPSARIRTSRSSMRFILVYLPRPCLNFRLESIVSTFNIGRTTN